MCALNNWYLVVDPPVFDVPLQGAIPCERIQGVAALVNPYWESPAFKFVEYWSVNFNVSPVENDPDEGIPANIFHPGFPLFNSSFTFWIESSNVLYK